MKECNILLEDKGVSAILQQPAPKELVLNFGLQQVRKNRLFAKDINYEIMGDSPIFSCCFYKQAVLINLMGF